MLKFLKRLIGRADTEIDPKVVVQPVESDEDAIVKNAMLALQTGKVVYGDVEGGVLTSHISEGEGDGE